MYISPMRDAIDAGLHPTNHTDFRLDQMFMLWSAVNRISREEIGADQRVTPLEGLKAMTVWVAEQYGEQASKGSLDPGKLADMVVLEDYHTMSSEDVRRLLEASGADLVTGAPPRRAHAPGSSSPLAH